MASLAKFRIFGYVATLAMHVGNTVVCRMALQGEVMKDPDIRNMVNLENCYFTVWNIGFQMMYAAVGLYYDVKYLKSGCDKSVVSHYNKYRRYLFGTMIYPAALFILTIFWPIYLYDRNLVFPEYIDKVLSFKSNLIMHLGIVPVVLWEMAFLPRQYPRSHKNSLIHINLLNIVYFAWIIYMNSINGLWPYPFLFYLQGTVFFPLFFLLVLMLYLFHYHTQWTIMRLIWGNSEKVKSS